MNKEEMFDYYGQPDDGGFMRLHAYDLQQLIKNGNASYNMLSDINKLNKALSEMEKQCEALREESKHWEDNYWDLYFLQEETASQMAIWRTAAKMMIAQVDPQSPAWKFYWDIQDGYQKGEKQSGEQ